MYALQRQSAYWFARCVRESGVIGPHRNYPNHLFALGHSGDSVTGAFLAARLVTKSLLGASEKPDRIFAFTR